MLSFVLEISWLLSVPFSYTFPDIFLINVEEIKKQANDY